MHETGKLTLGSVQEGDTGIPCRDMTIFPIEVSSKCLVSMAVSFSYILGNWDGLSILLEYIYIALMNRVIPRNLDLSV